MIYLVFVVAVLTRFLMNSHLPGFSPVFGALLFSGARLRKRDAIWFPVVVLAIGDWLLTTQVFRMEVRWGTQSLSWLSLPWPGSEASFARTSRLSGLRGVQSALLLPIF